MSAANDVKQLLQELTDDQAVALTVKGAIFDLPLTQREQFFKAHEAVKAAVATLTWEARGYLVALIAAQHADADRKAAAEKKEPKE